MHKDLHLVALSAYENGVPLPSGNLVKEIFSPANQAGLGDKDFSVIFEHITSGK
jgi:3-hydroxyisobutyrate dehydrogenase-like beta-hydroxyacid dehydrogenase